jgi:hypothetical protein
LSPNVKDHPECSVIKHFEDGKLDLYNLRQDLGERRDVSGRG